MKNIFLLSKAKVVYLHPLSSSLRFLKFWKQNLIEWWITLTMGFFNDSGNETEFFPVFKNGIFQQFSRSAVFPPSLYKKISIVKVVYHSILDKIKKNQVNRCSRFQDLGAWKWPNFIRRGKLPIIVNKGRFELRKIPHRVPVYLIPFNLIFLKK